MDKLKDFKDCLVHIVHVPDTQEDTIRVLINNKVVKEHTCSKKKPLKTLKKILIHYGIDPMTHRYYAEMIKLKKDRE